MVSRRVPLPELSRKRPTNYSVGVLCIITVCAQCVASVPQAAVGALLLLGLSVAIFAALSRGGAQSVAARGVFALGLGALSWALAVGSGASPDLAHYLESRESVHIEGTVRSAADRSQPGRVRFVVVGRIDRAFEGRVMLQAVDLPWIEIAQVESGDYIEARGALVRRKSEEDEQWPFSYTSYLRRRGVAGVLEVEAYGEVVRRRLQGSLKTRLLERFVEEQGDGEAESVLLASVLGTQYLLGEELKNLFRHTGTSHLLVVSGFHVGIVFLFVSRVARFFYSRSERLLTLLPVQVVAPLVALCATWLYVLLVGRDVTTVRSFFILALFAVGSVLCRRTESLRSILLAFIFVLLLWPGAFFEVSFQLTFSALFGLHLGGRWVSMLRRVRSPELELARMLASERWRGRELVQRVILEPLLLSTGACLGTTPILLLWFQSFVPLAPLINLAAIPYFSFVCIGFGGASLLLWSCGLPLSGLLLTPTLLSVDVFLWCLRWLDCLLGTGWLGYWQLSVDGARLGALAAAIVFAGAWAYPLSPGTAFEGKGSGVR